MHKHGVPIPILAPSRRPVLRIVEAAGAGFPSPAQDWEETGIDLMSLLAIDRAASFVFRVSGDSMKEAGIEDHDTLIVDRDVDPRPGSIVIAVCDGGFVVRQISLIEGRPHLVGRNAERAYEPRLCDEQIEIWGVVRTVVRNMSTH
jgi:DNA polymerase V